MRVALCTLVLSAGVLAGCGGGNSGNALPPGNTVAPSNAQADESAKRQKWSLEALGRAETAYNGLDFATAAKESLEATQWDPANPKPWELLARAEEKQGHFQPARDAYLRAARLSTAATSEALTALAARCSVGLAEYAFKHQQYKPAAEHARDALKANAQDADARRILANSLFHAGLHAEARPEYQRVADESTGATRQENLYWVGVCGLYLREHAEAEAVFDALIKEGYKTGDIYLWRGRCRFERKEIAGAKQDLRLAIEFATSTEQRKSAEDFLAELEKLDTDK